MTPLWRAQQALTTRSDASIGYSGCVLACKVCMFGRYTFLSVDAGIRREICSRDLEVKLHGVVGDTCLL